MEISRVNRGSSIKKEEEKISVGGKKSFSQSFSFARDSKSEEQLKEMLQDIKKKGDRLSVTKCYSDVRAYKRMIKEYLESVLSHMYAVKKDNSFWQTQYFITVDIIDNKLEELTKELMEEEKDKIEIASTVDYITGLIIDIYK